MPSLFRSTEGKTLTDRASAGWMQFNMLIFLVAFMVTVMYFRESFQKKEHDWAQDITILQTGLFVMMASSHVVAQYRV